MSTIAHILQLEHVSRQWDCAILSSFLPTFPEAHGPKKKKDFFKHTRNTNKSHFFLNHGGHAEPLQRQQRQSLLVLFCLYEMN